MVLLLPSGYALSSTRFGATLSCSSDFDCKILVLLLLGTEGRVLILLRTEASVAGCTHTLFRAVATTIGLIVVVKIAAGGGRFSL